MDRLKRRLLWMGVKWRNRSQIIDREETEWEPIPPVDVDKLGEFIRRTYKWTKDSLLDNIQSIGHMNWQLQEYGTISGDCDDLATYSSYLLLRMGYTVVYRINIWEERHVVCAFSVPGGWQVIDNRWIYPVVCNRYDAILGRSKYDKLITASEFMSLPLK